MPIRSIAVFCGSKDGKNAIYREHAFQLGKLLAESNVRIIYGGGSAGMMGCIADAAMQHGGAVTGIIPKMLVEWERQHLGITELIVSDDMHERKRKIYSLADAAIILAGGFGTMDELFEIITWNQLTIHDKQIFILNSAGFYDHLVSHIAKMREEGFLYTEADRRIFVIDEPASLKQYL